MTRYPNDPNLKLLLEVQDGNHPAAAELISSILDSGVINDAINKAKDLVSQGQHALKAVPYSGYVEALASLTETIVERKV